MKDKIELAGGAATSSHTTRFGYIPRQALVALANRIEVGVERHGDKAWNAQSSNFNKTNESVDWALERLAHVVDHAYLALEKLMMRKPWDGENDAGAIMFGGAALACSIPWQKLRENPVPPAVEQPIYNIGGSYQIHDQSTTTSRDATIWEPLYTLLSRRKTLHDMGQTGEDSVMAHELDKIERIVYGRADGGRKI